MFFPLKIQKIKDDQYTGTCRLVPEYSASGRSEEEIVRHAAVSLTSCLELHYRRQKLCLPIPDGSLKEGEVKIPLPLKLQLMIILWNELAARKMTISDLARMLAVTPSQALRFVDRNRAQGSTDTLEQVLGRFGIQVTAVTER